jgi:hypothetical protein
LKSEQQRTIIFEFFEARGFFACVSILHARTSCIIIALSASCGVGFVCNANGEKNHEIVSMGIEAVKNLTHRGAVGADGKTGDGAGVLTSSR